MSDDNQLDSADKRKMNQTAPHHHVEWTDIGTAEVSVDLFGHAKVHVIHEHDHSRRNGLIASISLAVIAVALVGYMLSANDELVPAESPSNSSQQPPALVIDTPSPEVTPASAVAPAVKPQAKLRAVVPPATTAASAPLAVKPIPLAKPAAVPKPKSVVTGSALSSPIQPGELGTSPSKPSSDSSN